MEEEEALRNYCRTMISRVRNKRQCPREHKHGGAKGSNWPETERQVASAHRGSNLHVLERNIDPASPHVGQGPAVPHAPFQLVTMLRIKTLKEEMRRVAEVELHGPAVCSVCAQEQASLALKTFIRRKKTQLQIQALKSRLNTRLGLDTLGGVGTESLKALQCPSLDLRGTTWQRYAGHSNLGFLSNR
ncbi:uncharacterized protein LOC143421553 [Maylandia zebra]|uniref:uncharacterized protein LOC143421553 n=1 Tax=Maylandia zebra TaxID=106582 RepID=UPI00032A25AE